MLHTWKIVIRPDPEAPDLAQGWALARSQAEALALVGHPAALAFPSAAQWPGQPGSRLSWSNGGAAVLASIAADRRGAVLH